MTVGINERYPAAKAKQELKNRQRRELERRMISDFVCKHGLSAKDGRYNGTWAAPFSHCRCCGTVYFYVDSALWTRHYDGTVKSEGRSFSKNLCHGCGGKYTEYSN